MCVGGGDTELPVAAVAPTSQVEDEPTATDYNYTNKTKTSYNVSA